MRIALRGLGRNALLGVVYFRPFKLRYERHGFTSARMFHPELAITAV
ncbi:MAG TPA: hypothetical protein VJ464_14665 [Blastocatellia bacterium]|nr:hypothetical protein [Blastocatellia bacterium]